MIKPEFKQKRGPKPGSRGMGRKKQIKTLITEEVVKLPEDWQQELLTYVREFVDSYSELKKEDN